MKGKKSFTVLIIACGILVLVGGLWLIFHPSLPILVNIIVGIGTIAMAFTTLWLALESKEERVERLQVRLIKEIYEPLLRECDKIVNVHSHAQDEPLSNISLKEDFYKKDVYLSTRVPEEIWKDLEHFSGEFKKYEQKRQEALRRIREIVKKCGRTNDILVPGHDGVAQLLPTSLYIGFSWEESGSRYPFLYMFFKGESLEQVEKIIREERKPKKIHIYFGIESTGLTSSLTMRIDKKKFYELYEIVMEEIHKDPLISSVPQKCKKIMDDAQKLKEKIEEKL